MAQANVFNTALTNALWYTDKVSIATGNTAVTFNVYGVALTYQQVNGTPATAQTAVGNIYSSSIIIPANAVFETYVGAGNRLTIVGNNFTAAELGTASSATAGVNGVGAG